MTDFNNNFDREFDWEDTIQEDAKEFILLPEGDYQFIVTGFERGRHNKEGKIPPCNKAIITIKIETEEGDAVIKHNLLLHSLMEGMLSAFFGAIGQKKHGEPLKMNWNTVMGAKGVCKVSHREYEGKKYNNVKSMIYADSVDWTKVLNRPNQGQPTQQPAAQPQQGGWSGF